MKKVMGILALAIFAFAVAAQTEFADRAALMSVPSTRLSKRNNNSASLAHILTHNMGERRPVR
jgi:hypothetical protein